MLSVKSGNFRWPVLHQGVEGVTSAGLSTCDLSDLFCAPFIHHPVFQARLSGMHKMPSLLSFPGLRVFCSGNRGFEACQPRATHTSEPNRFGLYIQTLVQTLYFFWPHSVTCGILVPWPGIEPVSPTVGAGSVKHWTAREAPRLWLLNLEKEKVWEREFRGWMRCGLHLPWAMRIYSKPFASFIQDVLFSLWGLLLSPNNCWLDSCHALPIQQMLCVVLMAEGNFWSSGNQGCKEKSCLKLEKIPHSKIFLGTQYLSFCHWRDFAPHFPEWLKCLLQTMAECILLESLDFCYFCKMWVGNMTQYFSKRCKNYIAYFGSFRAEIWNLFREFQILELGKFLFSFCFSIISDLSQIKC